MHHLHLQERCGATSSLVVYSLLQNQIKPSLSVLPMRLTTRRVCQPWCWLHATLNALLTFNSASPVFTNKQLITKSVSGVDKNSSIVCAMEIGPGICQNKCIGMQKAVHVLTVCAVLGNPLMYTAMRLDLLFPRVAWCLYIKASKKSPEPCVRYT